ncbi:WD repeat-containing protein 60 [Arapaima gigas]
MHSEKKMTNLHDTWRSDDLKKHIQGGGYDEDLLRKRERVRRDEDVRKHRSGVSVERRHRERDSTQERRSHGDGEKDKDRTRERRSHGDREKDTERHGTQERRSHRDREKDRERDAAQERTSHRDREKEREGDRTHERGSRRDGRERDGSRDVRSHRDRERARERDHRKDSTSDRVGHGDKRERERKEEWERDRMADDRKMETDKEGRVRRHERTESENRDRERRRAERDSENDADRHRRRMEGMEERDRNRDKRGEREKDRERHRERSGDKHRERKKDKDRYADKGPGRNTRHLKEGDDLEETQLEWRRRKEMRHGDREHRRHKEGEEYREHRRREKEERDRRRAREEREDRDREAEHERRRRERKEAEHNSLSGTEDRERRRREKEHLEAMTATGQRRSLSPKTLEEPWGLEEKEDADAAVGKVSSEDQGQEGAEEEYEDDFEDYEEDFEDIEDEDDAGSSEGAVREEVEAIRRAMEAENKRVGSVLLSPQAMEPEAREGDVPGPGTSQSRPVCKGKFIDFVAAKHREVSKKVAIKQKKRSSDLLRLIDLDFSITFSLLDLPPLSEYDMYIKSFGTTNTKQAYVQCNEDSADREIQTEEVEMCDRWTQHPADRGMVCGGPDLALESPEELARLKINTQRLAAFLLSASQVVSVLLEEDRAEKLSLGRSRTQVDGPSFSDGGLHFNPSVPFLHGREVALIVFSQVQRQTMLSVHRPLATSSTVRLDSNTILCVWNIWEPSRPQKILVYESEVLCCCFSPGRATLVFAGTAVGSLVLWDLREHLNLHYNIRIGDHEWTLRYPTFSTDSVLASSGHLSAVMSVEPIPTTAAGTRRPGLPFLSSKEESSGLSFQLASLDERGVLNLWVVVELPQADQAGSQNDLGLKPGGKVKLLLSSTIVTSERLSLGDSAVMDPVHTLMLKFLPSDSNHFFIGTSAGLVAHGTRHGPRRPPRFYKPRSAGPSSAHVTSLDFSPFRQPMLLVGCDDNTVRLHSMSTELPMLEWSCCGPVVSAQWSLTRPAVFCVLDGAPTLHLWDLLQKDSEPVVTEPLQTDGVTTMAVFGDPSKQNTFSGISLAGPSGKIEIQCFNARWTLSTPDELEKLESLLYGAP